jgi:hypothetical protein
MSVPFPIVPRGATVTPRLVRYGGDLVSQLGGPTQRIQRLGTRYAADVQLPPLDAECAGYWLAVPLHAEARGLTVHLVMPQMHDVHEWAGLPVTGTADAGAAQITYSGPTPLPGTWFSFVANGRNYLHLITSVFAADTLAISPRLRAPMVASPMEFLSPKLEGFCDETSWSLEWFRFVGHAFTITENA